MTGDLFSGSGTTGMAAVLEGQRFVGSEFEAGSYETAARRIAWASGEATRTRKAGRRGKQTA